MKTLIILLLLSLCSCKSKVKNKLNVYGGRPVGDGIFPVVPLVLPGEKDISQVRCTGTFFHNRTLVDPALRKRYFLVTSAGCVKDNRHVIPLEVLLPRSIVLKPIAIWIPAGFDSNMVDDFNIAVIEVSPDMLELYIELEIEALPYLSFIERDHKSKHSFMGYGANYISESHIGGKGVLRFSDSKVVRYFKNKLELTSIWDQPQAEVSRGEYPGILWGDLGGPLMIRSRNENSAIVGIGSHMNSEGSNLLKSVFSRTDTPGANLFLARFVDGDVSQNHEYDVNELNSIVHELEVL